MREDLNLERCTVVCHTISFLTLATAAGAEVDQRPLKVDVVPAFHHLEWPDDLTGADRGLRIDVRPLGAERFFSLGRMSIRPSARCTTGPIS